MDKYNITVGMLLHAIDLNANSPYVKIRSDGGWWMYPKSTSISNWFTDQRLDMTLNELNDLCLPITSDLRVVLNIINNSKVSIPKLTGIVYDMGEQGILANYSFAWNSYLYRVWDRDDKVMDYSIHVKKNESEHVINLPDREVSVDSKQFDIYVTHLNEHMQSINVFNGLYSNSIEWWDIDGYEKNDYDYNLPEMNHYIVRNFINYAPVYTEAGDDVEILKLNELTFKVLTEYSQELLTVDGSFTLSDLNDLSAVKKLSKASILFFLYVRYMITGNSNSLSTMNH